MITHADAWYDACADRAGLTRRQLLVWAGDRVAEGAPVFVEGVRWHLDGPLDAERLAGAFATTVAGADALRTVVEETDGWPALRAPSEPSPILDVVDLVGQGSPRRALDDLAHATIAACVSGRTSLAAVLVRLGADRHVLVLAQHQLASDAWSFGLLHRRLQEEYLSLASPERVGGARGWPQFAAYVAFERAYRRSPAAEAARRHWASARAGDRPACGALRAGRDATRVRRIVVPLGTVRSAAVRRVAAEQASADVGLFVFFAAAVAAHLQRTVDADDVVLDVPFANRPSARFKETLGTFMNVCPVRVGVARGDRVRELRARLVTATWEAARHQTFTGHGGAVPQAYDVLVNVHRPAVAAARFEACAMRVEWLPPTHRFGTAAVAVHDFGATGELTLVVDLSERAFSPGSRAAFAASLLRIVDEHLDDGDRRLADGDGTARSGAAVIGAAGGPVPAAGAAAISDAPATVWSRILRQSRATPEAIAVRCGDAAVTYAALASGAAEVAQRLAAAGAARDTVVAVWGARGPRWLRTLLGVLGAGAVYVPLDPAWPTARVGEVLRRSGARILVTDGAPPDLCRRLAAPGDAWTGITVEDDAPPSRAEPPSAPEPGDVAYLFYTSGSTGAPKGALVEHAGLLNHLEAKIGLLGLAPGDRVAQSAAAGFDVSLWQALAALLVGAEVEILPDDVVRAPTTLARVATERRVTVLEVVPSMLRLLLDAEEPTAGEPRAPAPLAALRFLVVTGEALPPELCRRWFARHAAVPLVNAYGPTECADDVTHHVLDAAPAADAVQVPIGRPIPGMQVYVLDAALRPVPDGAVGELCVAGIGVARGYLGDPERTAAAFVTGALGPDGAPVRVYRTGDRGRRLPDGTLVWLGRLDTQVKIHGVRVEPAEVEAVLGGHPAVRHAAVAARADASRGPRLVAYVVLADEDEARSGAAPAAEARALARVREWERLWDDTYARESPVARDATFDTVGWQSRYTRLPIPAAEMREWLDAVVARVRRLAPRVVLEIGCGAGLVLARLAPACARWIATDVSAAAVAWVQRRHLAHGALPHVEVVHGAAHAIGRLVDVRPDVVVLNSVVQYFPSLAYLHDVLVAAWGMLDAGGAIFVGDLRSLPLAPTLHTSIEVARASAACSVGELRTRIERGLAQEGELMIDPAFFAALARAYGGTVDVQLKRGRAHNELTRFRYDVVWRRGTTGGAAAVCDAAGSARGVGAADTDTRADTDTGAVGIPWSGAGPTLAVLRRRLAERPRTAFELRGVPNPRLQRETLALEVLAASPDATTVGALREAIAARPLVPGLDPEDLWDATERASHDVVIGWSPAGLDRYDACFRPRPPRREARCHEVAGNGSADATVAADAAGPCNTAASGAEVPAAVRFVSETSRRYANDPCGSTTLAARVEELRAFARARLPEAMVPAAFVVLGHLPLTANGKVDHAALAAFDDGRMPGAGGDPPASPLEHAVAAIWSRWLGVAEIGRAEDFFALGGDSLLVYRVLAALRAEIGVELALEDLLARPTVAGTAAALATAALAGVAAEDAAALLADVEALGDDEAAAILRADRGVEEVVDV